MIREQDQEQEPRDQELHKPVIKKFKRNKVYTTFKDNIWVTKLAEMGSLSSKDRGAEYLLCMIDVCNKYPWVKPFKDIKFKKVIHGFIEIVSKSKRKQNKLLVDQGREFYNNLMQKWLLDNGILMYLTHNQGKSVVTARFIRVKFIKNYS